MQILSQTVKVTLDILSWINLSQKEGNFATTTKGLGRRLCSRPQKRRTKDGASFNVT